MLQWSGRSGAHAVIGVSVDEGVTGNFPPFQNHPLSGSPTVTSVASLNLDRGIEWTDVIYKIGDVTDNELDTNRSVCVALYVQDIGQFGSDPSLPRQPCPCSLFQAFRDRRFLFNFAPNRQQGFFSNVRPYLCLFEFFGFSTTQECCYSFVFDSS